MTTPHETRETLLPAYFGEFGGQFVPESLIPALDPVSYTHLTLPTICSV